jgi:hypothetical protein
VVSNPGRSVVSWAPIVDGGVDPVGIAASVGDTLQITIQLQGQPVSSTSRVVPRKSPPRVVRTRPRRRQARVPLNSSAEVIFTEPIDPTSVHAGSVQLLGPAPVSATLVSVSNGAGVEIIPDGLLQPSTVHTIAVSGIRDLSGESLAEPFSSQFTTTDAVGAIRVITETSQPEMEDDGLYRIVLDGLEGPMIGVQDTLVWDNVSVGLHKVSLSGIGPTCQLTSNTPGDVLVRAGETETLVFEVTCVPGSVSMGIVFSGGPIDPIASVTWTFNDEFSWTLPFSSFLDHGLGYYAYYARGGEWKIELTLPKNCVAEDNPRTVLVTASYTLVIFEVRCYPGLLEVTTVTSGTSTDPDGYELVIDGAEAFPFAANEERTLYGIQPGDRVLELTGIDSHCTLSGDNPRTVTVGALEVGGSATFELVCSASGATQD